jgi:hypothetical protein
MLSGANDLRSIWRWGRRLTPKGLAMLGIDRGRAPCHATYHYVFRAIPAADLERALGAAVRLDGALGHVAIDGKRLRGSQHETSPGVHMLQAFSIRLQASIGSLVVPPDSGEVVEALKLLKDLPLEGAVLTGEGLSGILCQGPVLVHRMMNLSSNRIANCDFASDHSLADIFHSAVASRKTR